MLESPENACVSIRSIKFSLSNKVLRLGSALNAWVSTLLIEFPDIVIDLRFRKAWNVPVEILRM